MQNDDENEIFLLRVDISKGDRVHLTEHKLSTYSQKLVCVKPLFVEHNGLVVLVVNEIFMNRIINEV